MMNTDPDVASALRLSLADADIDPLANRTDRALAVIRRGILSGLLRPGQQLVESDIAEMLGMSKTPVREALKTLVGSGLVVLSRFKGAVVRELDVDEATAIFDLRLLLEPEAVRRSVANGSTFEAASAALDRAESAGADGYMAMMSLSNREFHHAFYAGCGNPLLVSTLTGLEDQAALISTVGWRSAGGWEEEAEEHGRILASAQAGDADGTAQLVRAHIETFVHRVIPLLAQPEQ